jgi:SAM-dependent methyltransferase
VRRLAIIAIVGVLAVGAAGVWRLTHRHLARNVRYEPTSQPVLDVMLQFGDLSRDSVVYDLGCGDGRLVIAAVKRSGARGVCVEIDPILMAIAETSARAEGVHDRIRFLHEDIRNTDVSDATVVMLYLSRRFNLELRPRLVRMMRPGTRIVSHFHDMGDDWPPRVTRRVRDPDGLVHPIFLWWVPEDKSKLVPGG